MKQRFAELDHRLCLRAAISYLTGKWQRRDTMAFLEEYTGISRKELWRDELDGSCVAKNEAVEGVACFLEDLMQDLLDGYDPDCIDPVEVRDRVDGMTGKVRQIACLCIPHQLLGHLCKLGLDPLFRARILPQQHASVPGRGQTGLVNQTQRYLRRHGLNIRYYQKVDAVHAYASVSYAVATDLIRSEIPSARWIIVLMEFLGKIAPDGHLIIGGYLDAWLFNFVMSYLIRHVLEHGRSRRGVWHPDIVRIESYMDDLAILGPTKSGIRRAVRELARWSEANLHVSWRTTSGIIRIWTAAEEHQAKRSAKPAQRGCPNIDVAGFQIHRTYTTMRPRVCKRTRRCFLRAWRRICETGTISRQTAGTIIARYGALAQTASMAFRIKYHVDECLAMAKRIVSNWQRYQARKRRSWIINALKNPV